MTGDQVRDVFERFLKLFPTSGRHWKMYIEFEVRMGHPDKVEAIFQRCLLKVPAVDLWKTYVGYMRDTKRTLPDFREVMTQAYEFTLEHVGLDLNSTSIWLEYIDFLKSQDAAGNPHAEGMKMDRIRRTYQKAVVSPIAQVEDAWKGYDAYENGLNRITAKKLLAERSAAYMTARSSFKERKLILDTLPKNWMPVPVEGSARENQVASIWRRFINYEKSNPLKLEDPLALVSRVIYAYRQCLLSMPHHVHFWIDAVVYLETNEQIERAALLLKAGSELLPENLLLQLFYADFEERRGNAATVKEIFDNLIKAKQQEIDQKEQRAPVVKPAEATAAGDATDTAGQSEGNDDNANRELSLAYIHQMRFLRRTEGLKAARPLFITARKDPRTTHHLYVASAHMEYHHASTDIATKIFRAGFGAGKLKGDAGYSLAFLDFLASLNEDNTTRAAFEELVAQTDKSGARALLSKFLAFESENGSTAAIRSIDERIRTMYAADFDNKPVSIAALTAIDRFKFQDAFPCSDAVLASMDYARDPTSGTAARVPVGASSVAPLASEPKSRFPMPDTAAMTPLKVDATEFLQQHSFGPSGGAPAEFSSGPAFGRGASDPPAGPMTTYRFPVALLPPAIASLLLALPPPDSFSGPFVNEAEIMQLLPAVVHDGHHPQQQQQQQQQQQPFLTQQPGALQHRGPRRSRFEPIAPEQEMRRSTLLPRPAGAKRRFENDSDEEQGSGGEMSTADMDLYRHRQQRRLTQN
ncbi:hypothetical protein, variant [Capsaspora owczarzaki ATCC 30864]|nr:hypothetical protein, variant [Capsaspora owczarzaki ATCC 30864]